ncbi:bifunctional folylpolyglutamate synthase/dihydrofolate synthase [bacterium]|nr:bifunctional folylpolyglutamate synthase/dihydrofolate synthase [bacterium]
MNYKQCLEYLEHVQAQGIKFGLDNVRTLLSSVDNPHQKYPSILVAGSNGKGSVCAMLTRILSLHHYKAGLYTSPHLIRTEERIQVGKNPVPPESFCRLLSLLKEKIEQLIERKKLSHPPTFFEHMTCLAFLYFQEQNVDMAVLEVGMGGRFDATNVVDPALSVITTVSMEHKEFLGESLSQIAFEKAGVLKPGVEVVCGVEKPEAYATIKKRAQEVKAPFYGVFENGKECLVHRGSWGYSFEYRSDSHTYKFTPALHGEHQGKNASVAILASERLSPNWGLETEKIIQGIETTEWEARLEVISRSPLILLDGAHNEEGALALREYIQNFVPPPLVLVFAVMKNKEIEKVADILFPLTEKVILTRFPFHKSASPQQIKDRTLRYRDRLLLEPEVSQAVPKAVQLAGEGGSVIISGSLFLAGEVKKLFPRGNFHP